MRITITDFESPNTSGGNKGLLAAASLMALLTLAALPVSTAQEKSLDRSFVAMVGKSGLIFKGTVKTLHSATPTVPVENSTAIVHVDEVLEAPESMGDLAGQDVTLRLVDPEAVKPGEARIFFTVVYSLGSSVGVAEIGSQVVEKSSDRLRSQIREARQQLIDDELARRLVSADVVVVGKVGETRPTPETEKNVPSSEHDPLWWEAMVQVESVAKGKPIQGQVILYFPHTYDQRWGSAPKFEKGQEGIFLLHAEEGKKFGAGGYTALDAQDFQPKNQMDKVRRLMAQSHQSITGAGVRPK